MSVTLSNILTLVRYSIEDNSKSGSDIFTYANSSVFTLKESNVSEVTTVLLNDSELSSGQYSYSSSTNKLTVSASCSSGDTIEIQYSYYPNYSDTEIKNFIRSALIQLSLNNYTTFTVDPDDDEIYPDPTDEEKNLIAGITAILINKPVDSYRLPDVTMNFPKDLPMHDKISKMIAIFKKNTHGLYSMLDDAISYDD